MFALIDSNIFVDHFRGRNEATEFLKKCIIEYDIVYYLLFLVLIDSRNAKKKSL